MRPRCLAVLLLWSSFAPAALAAVTTEVIDLPSRGVTQRILYAKPDAPVATIVYVAGGTGADANHRYMVNASIRDLMVTKRWVAEGDGPDLVVMCSPV